MVKRYSSSPQSYVASPAIRDHTVLPATRHRWKRPSRQAGTRFTYSGGIEGWVGLDVGYMLGWFTCPQSPIQVLTPCSRNTDSNKAQIPLGLRRLSTKLRKSCRRGQRNSQIQTIATKPVTCPPPTRVCRSDGIQSVTM